MSQLMTSPKISVIHLSAMDFAALIERAVSFVLWFLKLYAVGTFLGLFSFRQVEKRDAQLVALRKENAELRASAERALAQLAHQEHVIRQLTEFCDAHPAYLEDKEAPTATTRQRRSTRIQRT